MLLKVSRLELVELYSFLYCVLSNIGTTSLDVFFRGLDPLILARIHERVIWMMDDVFKSEHMEINELQGRKRLPLEERA